MALYRWANLEAQPYKDFSFERKQARAELRQRSAQMAAQAEEVARPGPLSAATPARDAQSPAQVRGGGLSAFADARARAHSDLAEGEDMRPARFPLRRNPRALVQVSAPEAAIGGGVHGPVVRPATEAVTATALPGSGFSAPEVARTVEAFAALHSALGAPDDPAVHAGPLSRRSVPLSPDLRRPAVPSQADPGAKAIREDPAADAGTQSGAIGSPSWISGMPLLRGSANTRSPLRESLQHSREKVAARWYALRGLFEPAAAEAEHAEFHVKEQLPPVLAIFSVAGGVGKSSLAASLTRALAGQGERVLLVDTTKAGVLPFYLGARELRPDVVRTFAPPPGSLDQPIHLVSYASEPSTGRSDTAESLSTRIKRDGKALSRIIVDLSSSATQALEELVRLGADVLIPLAPDMNAVIGLPAVKRAMQSITDSEGAQVKAHFVLVQFDPSQPLQLDIREVLQQQLGDRLLPFAVRRSPAVAEALAEGMTVIDYAPGEGIARDVLQLAAWVRSLAEPAREGIAQARWSER